MLESQDIILCQAKIVHLLVHRDKFAKRKLPLNLLLNHSPVQFRVIFVLNVFSIKFKFKVASKMKHDRCRLNTMYLYKTMTPTRCKVVETRPLLLYQCYFGDLCDASKKLDIIYYHICCSIWSFKWTLLNIWSVLDKFGSYTKSLQIARMC